MNTLRKAPPLQEIIAYYVQYRKVSGLKPLDRSHVVYQLLYHASRLSQGMLTLGLLEWWWKRRTTE